jgi:hypothetical protein
MSRRIPALALLFAAIAGAFVFEANDNGRAPVAATSARIQPGVVMPVAAPASALSSTWYCAGGTADAKGFGDHQVVIANASDRDLSGTVTVFTGHVAPPPPNLEAGTATTVAAASTTTAVPSKMVVHPVTLGARSRVTVRLGDVIAAPMAAALIEINGGEVAVEHELSGPYGRTAAPCSTTAAADWSVPWGVTTVDANEIIALFNPFPDDATLDIAFVTDAGTREPIAYQGLVVPGRSVVAFNVAEGGVADRAALVSTRIVARSGRIVVDRIQTFDGSAGVKGITVGTGAAAAAETWIFPEGKVTAGVDERFVVYNPADVTATVNVEIRPQDPTKVVPPEPFELTIPPRQSSPLVLRNEDRIPKDLAHSTVVRSLNGVGVIAERQLIVSGAGDQQGVTSTLGSTFIAPQWVFAAGSTSKTTNEWILVVNGSNDAIAKVTITALTNGQTLAIQDLQEIEIPPASRLAISIGDKIERDDLALLVSSTEPIIAERGLYQVGSIGISSVFGVPLADGLAVPVPFAAG